jgi:hypothetical protein
MAMHMPSFKNEKINNSIVVQIASRFGDIPPTPPVNPVRRPIDRANVNG